MQSPQQYTRITNSKYNEIKYNKEKSVNRRAGRSPKSYKSSISSYACSTALPYAAFFVQLTPRKSNLAGYSLLSIFADDGGGRDAGGGGRVPPGDGFRDGSGGDGGDGGDAVGGRYPSLDTPDSPIGESGASFVGGVRLTARRRDSLFIAV